MSSSTYSLDALVQQQLDTELQQEEAAKAQRELEKQKVAGGIATRVRKLLDNDDLDGLKALENGTLPPETVSQDDYDQLQQEKDAADQQITRLTAQVDQLKQENQQLKATTPPATPARRTAPPAAAPATTAPPAMAVAATAAPATPAPATPAPAAAATPASTPAPAAKKKGKVLGAVKAASHKFVTGESKQ